MSAGFLSGFFVSVAVPCRDKAALTIKRGQPKKASKHTWQGMNIHLYQKSFMRLLGRIPKPQNHIRCELRVFTLLIKVLFLIFENTECHEPNDNLISINIFVIE